jgi:hypothetical protein
VRHAGHPLCRQPLRVTFLSNYEFAINDLEAFSSEVQNIFGTPPLSINLGCPNFP